MKSPSVCNRQSTRLKIIYNKEKIRQVLSLQKGTGGFTDTIGALIMVAGDLKSFSPLMKEIRFLLITASFA